MLPPIAIAILLCCLAHPRAAAVSIGDPFPWFVAQEVIPYGPPISAPLALEQYRGAPIILVVFSDELAASPWCLGSLGQLHREYRPTGIQVFGVTRSRLAINKTLAESPLTATILIVDETTFAALGPIEANRNRSLLIDSAGRVCSADTGTFVPPKRITQAREGTTPYGEWMALARPWEPGLEHSPAKSTWSLVHSGSIGKALERAQKQVDDTDASLAGEYQFLVTACQEWIDRATAIEERARAEGDHYLSALIADALADMLRGHDAGQAAKARATTDKQEDGYKTGKDFYRRWQSAWGKPSDVTSRLWASYLKGAEEDLYHARVRSWSSEGSP